MFVNIFKFLLRAYRLLISPILGQRCRFYPSCSRYGEECLEKYGFWRGGSKTAFRLMRCQPFHPGGVDLP